MDKCIDVNELYKRDPKLKKEDVRIILEWIEKQGHLPKIAELQAALALHSCFYSIESAKNCLENFFTIRNLCTDLFSNPNPDTNPELEQALKIFVLTILPQKTAEGYTIVLSRLINTNPDLYNPQAGSKLFDMLALLDIHVNGPSNGFVVVMDMKGGVFGHLAKVNLGDFKKFMVYLQTAMPIRLMAIHFINIVPFMDKVMSIVKPFMNKDLFEKIVIHTNNDTLYNYIPKEYMPADYGGKGEPINVLHEKFKSIIYDNQWFFQFQESQVVDENKRSGPRENADNLFGFDGTFKKLEVD